MEMRKVILYSLSIFCDKRFKKEKIVVFVEKYYCIIKQNNMSLVLDISENKKIDNSPRRFTLY